MDIFSDTWREIAARPSGPLAFRFYLQPLMAAILAVKDGLRDARTHRPPYLATLFTSRGQRKALVRDAWASIGRVFLLAMVVDLAYQLGVIHYVRPLQGLFVSVLLALVPYVLLRGPVDRFARRLRGTHPQGKTDAARSSGAR